MRRKGLLSTEYQDKEKLKFNQESYNISNSWGIDKITNLLLNRGCTIIPKESEDYGLDIKCINLFGAIEYWEVETKAGYSWTTKKDFRFPTVSFLARKEKWAYIGFWYIIICRETLAYVKCHSSIIFNPEYKETLDINAKWRKGIDIFYRVPKNLCQWGFVLPTPPPNPNFVGLEQYGLHI